MSLLPLDGAEYPFHKPSSRKPTNHPQSAGVFNGDEVARHPKAPPRSSSPESSPPRLYSNLITGRYERCELHSTRHPAKGVNVTSSSILFTPARSFWTMCAVASVEPLVSIRGFQVPSLWVQLLPQFCRGSRLHSRRHAEESLGR